jgi:signal transduction histidine kinase
VQEVAQVMQRPMVALFRYDSDGMLTVLAAESDRPHVFNPGTRWPLESESWFAPVYRTGRPARIEDYTDLPGAVAAAARESGLNATAGAPIIVNGSVWGAMGVASPDGPLPDQAEHRLAAFTDLVATAIANAESRAELEASRARIVATADATRRRIERDLHDGAQQRLVSLGLEVRTAQASVPNEMGKLRDDLSHIAEGLTSALDELREIALGIHPALLAESGLGPALKTLAQRSPIPVVLNCQAEGRLPEHVEVAAYYIVSEALTNAAKHACASKIDVEVGVLDRALRVAVADDGVGGADPGRGSGLLGLKDRAAAIGGKMLVVSRPGEGTSLVAELPLGG